MSYIGNPLYQVAFVVDTFSGNGSTTAFTTSVAPANTASVLVVISGVVQDPSTYSVSGNTLTFSAAPPTGTSNISARYLGIPASGITTTAYRTVTTFTATAGQTTFTPPSYTAGFINVYRNGVLLTPTSDYTATNGTTVVLISGATSGDTVIVESFLVSSILNGIPNTTGSVSSSNLVIGAALNSLPQVTSSTYNLEYLIVAGGGGGGARVGGGGGAGGVLNGFITVTSGTGYSLVVGSGGAGGTNTSGSAGTQGSNSTGFGLTAIGGGYGAGLGTVGGTGGSGGGSSYTSTAFGAGTAGQGFSGGCAYTIGASYGGGGGGGAGQTGGQGTSLCGGNGGSGVQSKISGSYAYYAGGGGGGLSSQLGGTGGAGGGGQGGNASPGSNATTNTGGGGGGGGDFNLGGAGASGIIIVSYAGAQRGSGGTITSANGYTIHTFTSNGTFTA